MNSYLPRPFYHPHSAHTYTISIWLVLLIQVTIKILQVQLRTSAKGKSNGVVMAENNNLSRVQKSWRSEILEKLIMNETQTLHNTVNRTNPQKVSVGCQKPYWNEEQKYTISATAAAHLRAAAQQTLHPGVCSQEDWHSN